MEFKSPDGVPKQIVIPSADLVNDPKDVFGRMADQGYRLDLSTKAREQLATFIYKTSAPFARKVERPGWEEETGCYVFPDEVIGEVGGEPVHYAPTGNVTSRCAVSGTLDDWREQIGQYCQGNSRLVLSVSFAFAAPLLLPLDQETGGIHWRGATSIGKSTALHVAGSVWGGGGTTGYINQWRATTNGLEAIAWAHNDALLVLDELSQLSNKDVSNAIYMLSNQASKGRMTKDGGLARIKNWRMLLLSSGELSLVVGNQYQSRECEYLKDSLFPVRRCKK